VVKREARPVRKNLVLTRVGVNSLHPGWVDGDGSRNWDLYLSPYQPIEPEPGLDLVVGDVVRGPKWSGIREVLNQWDGWREYDYIWLPDDDIRTSAEAVTRMFDVAKAMGLELFAPALDEESYYAHFDTKQNTRFFGRWVGFVEIMIPGFSTRALERLLPTLDLSETGWGWGLDSVWPKLLDYENVGIIDGITVTHTRPVGEMRDAQLRRRVLDESDALLGQYDCQQVHATFGAFGADLERLEMTPERLLVELVGGASHLIDRDPRVLSWIVDFQKPHFTWVEYPVEGTPS
jgi:hypothetical protein